MSDDLLEALKSTRIFNNPKIGLLRKPFTKKKNETPIRVDETLTEFELNNKSITYIYEGNEVTDKNLHVINNIYSEIKDSDKDNGLSINSTEDSIEDIEQVNETVKNCDENIRNYFENKKKSNFNNNNDADIINESIDESDDEVTEIMKVSTKPKTLQTKEIKLDNKNTEINTRKISEVEDDIDISEEPNFMKFVKDKKENNIEIIDEVQENQEKVNSDENKQSKSIIDSTVINDSSFSDLTLPQTSLSVQLPEKINKRVTFQDREESLEDDSEDEFLKKLDVNHIISKTPSTKHSKESEINNETKDKINDKKRKLDTNEKENKKRRLNEKEKEKMIDKKIETNQIFETIETKKITITPLTEINKIFKQGKLDSLFAMFKSWMIMYIDEFIFRAETYEQSIIVKFIEESGQNSKMLVEQFTTFIEKLKNEAKNNNMEDLSIDYAIKNENLKIEKITNSKNKKKTEIRMTFDSEVLNMKEDLSFRYIAMFFALNPNVYIIKMLSSQFDSSQFEKGNTLEDYKKLHKFIQENIDYEKKFIDWLGLIKKVKKNFILEF